MKFWFAAIVGFAVIAAWAAPAEATVYSVSPGGPITSLKSILGMLSAGDIVEIEPGTYNEVMKIRCNGTPASPIIIRGVGATRPVFDATGQNVNGVGANPRAIFQIEGANIIMENIEMIDARNGNNGAGIRLLNSTNAVIRNCKISYCDMGMMGGDTVSALIEDSDIGFNGTPLYDGYSHNMYMSGAGGIVVRGSYIHDALHGQNFKSRAHYNELWYNWIADSNEGEVGPVEGSDTAAANSNFLMVGNTVISKSGRTGNHVKYVIFGSDSGSGQHNGTMYMFNNTLIANDGRAHFVAFYGQGMDAVIRNNVFYGSDHIVEYWGAPVPVTGSHNWMETTSSVPPQFTDSVVGVWPGFRDYGSDDYRLLSGSTPIDEGSGSEDMWYVDGDGVVHDLVVDESYLYGAGRFPRLAAGTIDIGAYEYITPPTVVGDATGDGAVDGADYTLWADNYLSVGVPPWLNGGCTVGNFNDDLVVDDADYTLWADNYGYGVGGSAPEPLTVALLALGAAAVLRRRRA